MTAIAQQAESILGEVLEHKMLTPDGWGVALIKAGRARIPITGKLIGVRIGDTVEVVGVWFEHVRFGRQFKSRSCTVQVPKNGDAIVKWLASRLPDVGENRARAMVDAFGEDLWHVIEHETPRLTSIEGITDERATAIAESYAKFRDERDHMILLRGFGLTDGQVARCIDVWGSLEKVVPQIRNNPYALSEHVYGFGFLRSDAIAKNMGMAPDAPPRIRAAILHVLDEASGDGHCYVSGSKLQKQAAALLKLEPGLIGPEIVRAAKDEKLARHGWRVYCPRLDRAEMQCAQGLRRLLKSAVAA